MNCFRRKGTRRPTLAQSRTQTYYSNSGRTRDFRPFTVYCNIVFTAHCFSFPPLRIPWSLFARKAARRSFPRVVNAYYQTSQIQTRVEVKDTIIMLRTNMSRLEQVSYYVDQGELEESKIAQTCESTKPLLLLPVKQVKAPIMAATSCSDTYPLWRTKVHLIGYSWTATMRLPKDPRDPTMAYHLFQDRHSTVSIPTKRATILVGEAYDRAV